MVHKCFCATKQIGCSEYTAKNQTICFKRTQELLKPSWNIAGEKAAAAPISWGRLALFFHHMWLCGPSQPACITQQCCFQWGGKFPSLSPKGSTRWSWPLEKKGIKLLGFNLLLTENWFWRCLILFLDYTLMQNEMGALKDYFIPGVPNISSHSSTEVSSIHSSFGFHQGFALLQLPLLFAVWNKKHPLLDLFAPLQSAYQAQAVKPVA